MPSVPISRNLRICDKLSLMGRILLLSLVSGFCAFPLSLVAGIRVDTKKILLLNAYPEAARALSKEMSGALIVSNDRHMPVAQKKELLLKSVTRARDAMNSVDIEKGFLDDVERHLKMLEKAVRAGDFETAADIVGSYDKAIKTYVWVVGD